MQLYDPPKSVEICWFWLWAPFGMAKPLGIWYDDFNQILALGDALGPELWQFLCPRLPPNVQILIDEIFLTWPYGHLQAWFLVFYYWISYEKSNDGYSSSGGWTFCKFVDFRLFILYMLVWERKREGKIEGKRKGKMEGKGKREGNYQDSEGTLMRSRV